MTKKIDPKKFSTAEKDRFEELKALFSQVHPNSFTQQKLFLINKFRRNYLLVEEAVEKAALVRNVVKPKIKPKPKLS